MEEYHRAWLEGHPEYDASWLHQAIEAGFHVHHLDGDHGNNDPSNLVLIERNDHFRLHGTHKLKPLAEKWEESAKRVSLGKSAYQMRLEENPTWREIGERLGYEENPAAKAIAVASRYAKYHRS